MVLQAPDPKLPRRRYHYPVDTGGYTTGVEHAPRQAPQRQMRVLVVIKCLGFGGAERLVVDTVVHRNTRDFHYEVAYVLEAQHALASAIAETGTPVHALGARNNRDLRWMGRLRNLIVEGRFDVVHFHLPYAAGLGRIVVGTVPARRRPATMTTEHSLWNKMAIPLRVLNRVTIGRDGALIVVSQAAQDALPRAVRPRSRVVVHGVDLTRAENLLADRDRIRKEVRAELGMDDTDLLVLTVANLRAEKGYDVLLDATRILVDHGAAVCVVSVGAGPLDMELRAAHRDLHLGDRFRFLGARGDVSRLLVAADMFVLASHHEGMPVVLMEATSVGLPIVATAVGGIPQVITDGRNGLLVPPGRPDALAAAVEHLVDQPALRLRLGRAAKETSEVFDVAAATSEIETVYRRLARGRG